MVVVFTTYVISAYHYTKVVSWNPAHGEVIHLYVMLVCQHLCSFLGTPVSSINKTDSHDITEILLKMVLNTINLLQLHTLNIVKPAIHLYLKVTFPRPVRENFI